MVRRPSRPLTPISFRRDVRLFLITLTGFLFALIVILLFFLRDVVDEAERALWSKRIAVVDAAVADLTRLPHDGRDVAESTVIFLRGRYAIPVIELNGARTGRFVSGFGGGTLEYVSREIPGASVRFGFDDAEIRGLRRRYFYTAAISIAAGLLGLSMLLLYVPKITRPIEALLADARDVAEKGDSQNDADFVIQTFRQSITTLRMQEEELHRLHDQQKTRADDLQIITSTLARSLGSGLIVLGPDNRIVEVNAAAREILSLSGEATRGLTIAEALDGQAFARTLGEAVEHRVPVNRQEVEERAEGLAPRVIGLTTAPLWSEPSRFLGTLALFTELTQVRRLETRVRELQSLADLGVISAGIAHEFRNSLSTILGFLKLALRTELASEVAVKLRAAEDEANQLASAVTGLLQFARPMRLELAEVDLLALIEKIVDRLRETSPDIELVLTGGPVEITGDASLLARAFENLLRNAVDSVAETPTRRIEIVLGTEPDPSVEIRDSGAGIDETDVPKLFLPFHSTKPHGVGMGLPLARKIILVHGGTIALRSRKGEGTTVRIDFVDRAVSTEMANAAISV